MTAAATFRLVLPKAPWLACLHELRANYAAALRAAGHAVTLADSYLHATEPGEDFQMAFGAHAVAPPIDSARMIIAQSEHHDVHFAHTYRQTLDDARLIMNMGPFDFASKEYDALVDVVECPPGVVPVEAKYHCDAEREGVLFYGSVTARRARILEALSKAGVHVTALYGVLGQARDAYIDRAKVVLDLKQFGEEPSDATRAFWSLSRGACTLSENAPRGLLAHVDPSTIVSAVRELIASEEWRRRTREQYAAALGPTDMTPLLKALGLLTPATEHDRA